MYALVRSLLFRLEPEVAHRLTLTALDNLHRAHLTGWLGRADVTSTPVDVMGLTFANRVGLAAGLDKNADHLDALGALGFGFVEVGTVTPKPQQGNPRPRLFRLSGSQAIINRMGFNNAGVDHLVANVRKSRYQGVIGINIGKNLTTPVERAVDDYVTCLRKAHAAAHYVTVNISSPNTPGLRNLQFGDHLDGLLGALKSEVMRLDAENGRRVPLAVKIAPDMTRDELALVAKSLDACEIDGVIATNTTVSRENVTGMPHAHETGGLSGAPLFATSTAVVRELRRLLPGMPIIGAGGIDSGVRASEKCQAGADLVQLYTGFIYRGPELIGECVRATQNGETESMKREAEAPIKRPADGGP